MKRPGEGVYSHTLNGTLHPTFHLFFPSDAAAILSSGSQFPFAAEVKAWTEVPFLHPPAELRKDGVLKIFNKALSRKAEGQIQVGGSIRTSTLVKQEFSSCTASSPPLL